MFKLFKTAHFLIILLICQIAIASEPIPISYDSESLFSKDKSIKQKTIYLNEDGSLAFKKCFEYADKFYNERAWFGSSNDDLKGFIDIKGDTVIKPKYHSVSAFSDGIASVSIKNFQYFLIDENGTKLSDNFYDSVDKFHLGLLPISKNGKCSYINKDGLVIIDSIGKWCFNFTDDEIARVKTNNNLYSFINKNGVFVARDYQDANDFSDGLAIVKQSNKWGVINTKGEYVVNTIFENLNFKYKQGLLAAKKDKLWGFINKQGNWIIEPIYEDTYGFGGENNLAPVKKDGKWGYINFKGEIIIPIKFEMAWQFDKNGWGQVRSNNKRIYIDNNGNEIKNSYYLLLKDSNNCADFFNKL